MARIEVFPEQVVVKLSAAERALALRKRDIVLSRAAITSALITDDPWVWLRGVRSPGAHVPSKLAIGTWRSFGGTDFALIRSGRPAVVLDFDTSDHEDRGWVTQFDQYGRVIISTSYAAELIQALRPGEENAVFTTAS